MRTLHLLRHSEVQLGRARRSAIMIDHSLLAGLVLLEGSPNTSRLHLCIRL